MRFVDHIFDDQVVDDITLRVILPEGAKYVLVFRNVTYLQWCLF